MHGNTITTSPAAQAKETQPEVEAAPVVSRYEGARAWVVSNAWVTAALIFLVTRAVALAGAYSGVSYITSIEPARIPSLRIVVP
ncbi:MAG: hypothetical protein ABJA50_02930, partial [Chloroflexota bacterium]